jgi:hypothetical protein
MSKNGKKLTDSDLKQYHDAGYLILRGAFSKARVQSLVDAVNAVMDAALAGRCEISWIDKANRLPARLGNLLHPDKYQPAFAEWLAEDLAPQLETLNGGPVRHSLYGMLAGGGGMPYLQGWHRDLGKPGAPDEVEHLKRHHGRFVQFNAPLLDGDKFLNIIPGSHLRASTAAEIEVSNSPAFMRADNSKPVAAEELKQILAHDAKHAMPGGMVVEVEAGDIVYYNANLWHRGWNPGGGKRWTMHCAFWKPQYAVMQHEYNQRDAMLTPGHMDRMPPVTRSIIQNYLDNYPEKPKHLRDI